MKQYKINQHHTDATVDSVVTKRKRVYSAPAIRSAEPLEAVAVVCDPDIPGGPGKTLGPFNSGCGTLGS